MVVHVSLKGLITSLTVLFCLLPFDSNGQPMEIDSLLVEKEITAFSKNQSGDILLAFEGGAITKYNNHLDSVLSFSPSKIGDITLLEAMHGFQIFAFYNNFQEFAILDRFLTRNTRYSLSQTSVNYIDMCTFSRDQNLWAFEENQMRLVKINLSLRDIEIEIPLEFIIDSQDHHISFMKEYQNLVFLVDELSGIYIFDNLGNYLRKIEVAGVKQCGFNNNMLFYIENRQLHMISLYKNEQRTVELSGNDYSGVIATHDNLFLVFSRKVIRLSIAALE